MLEMAEKPDLFDMADVRPTFYALRESRRSAGGFGQAAKPGKISVRKDDIEFSIQRCHVIDNAVQIGLAGNVALHRNGTASQARSGGLQFFSARAGDVKPLQDYVISLGTSGKTFKR